tara:strand:- start:1144 stop:1707 length:564 start_codon:yes stop_codon:yes gene_type:complete
MEFSRVEHIGRYRFDAVAHGHGMVVSVELKKHLDIVMSDWWITGLNNQGELIVLTRMGFGLGQLGVHDSTAGLSAIYAEIVEPLVFRFRELGGLPSAPNAPTTATKSALCELHLDMHLREGNIGEHLGIRLDVARQYQLIKSFGLKAARPMIAQREKLPVSTISRRLYLAREAGILQKLSDVEDINT